MDYILSEQFCTQNKEEQQARLSAILDDYLREQLRDGRLADASQV